MLAVAVLPLLSWLTVASPLGARVRGRASRSAWARLPAPPPPPDSTARDSSATYRPSRRPKPALTDRYGDPFSNPVGGSPMQLATPDNVKVKVTVDDSLRYFDISERLGDTLNYRPPSRMSYKQYSEWQQQSAARNYFRSKAAGLDGESVTTTKRLIPKIYLPPALERIFGGSFVDIRPNGAVTIRAGYRHNRNFNPALPLRQQSVGDFDFDQTIQLNMTGQVGEKLKLNFNYDTKANFSFENQIKYDYTGSETDIIKKIEAGNVSMPLQSSLIQGGQNLFGAKIQAQFGRMTATVVGATVQGTQDEIRIQNGAQTRRFEIRCDQYDRDRHYYFGQFFRDRYDAALQNLPLVNSGIQIRRVEVYITNTSTLTADNLRNVVTLMDLGEPKTVFNQSLLRNPAPVAANNGANLLFDRVVTNGVRGQNTVDTYLAGQGLQKGRDFEHIRARKLDEREYKFNPQLGTLSLNSTLLPDQVLGIAYEYSYNGKVYKVGELSNDYANVDADQVIFLKMLKATNPALKFPTWDLMMKNVYSLNASQVTRENFQMNIVYKDDETGVNITSLKEGGGRVQDIPLVQVLGLDNVNPNNDRPSDGNFDFFPGITIDPDNGRVYFPKVEPFGSYLRNRILDPAAPNPPGPGTLAQVEKYVFQQLYDSVQTQAAQFTQYTKFFLTGRMQQSASDEVQLPGIRVVPGSVSVYAGGTRLTEGVDYQVFYDLARLKIINPSYLNSAAELRINVEKDAIIQVQPRRLVGTRLDYKVSNDLTVGGTAMHMIENPLINRVNLGDEPANNSIWGLDVNLRKESRFLTKMIDALPLVQTKELSAITFQGEFAQLVPGKSQLRGENGVSYLDDFENTETPYSLGGTFQGAWKLATPPVGVYNANKPKRESAYGRAKLAWYNIDQTYFATTGQKPSNISDADLKNHYTRGVNQREIYPNRDASIQNGYEYPLDLAYFPDERGPYNYTPDVTSDGIGLTSLPKQSWAGISRGITFDTDFDNANVEYLEFWLMDPFINSPRGVIDDQSGRRTPQPNTSGGTLYLNLGNISEDVVKDAARYEFENGLPADGSDQNTTPTPFGRGTSLSYLTDAFATGTGARANQDVGLDGLKDDQERSFFGSPATNPDPGSAAAYAGVADPSADNFPHHLDDSYTTTNTKILGRYKNFNGYQGNSPEDSPRAAYIFPDKEDLNRDNVVNDVDSYYEYQIPLAPGLEVGGGNGWIVDKAENPDINGDTVTWYLFRVPIRTPTRAVNGISGYKNIRFMRLYLTGWREPVVLRMNQMRFVANQWRKYTEGIAEDGGQFGVFNPSDAFTVSAVNIENNGAADAGGIPYVLPPGIQRDRDVSSQVNRRVNEQSLQLCVDGLKVGYGQAVWKNTALDMLIYKRLRMFVHGQSGDPTNPVPSDALRVFIRIGQDYSRNYYEYSLPLKITPAGSTTDGEIWPADNIIDVALAELVRAKALRNASNAPLTQRFTTTAEGDGRQITIIGNPDFSDVQSMMIGVLNPTKGLPGVPARPRSVCVWADELRVFDYDKTAGWAAVGRLNAKLADVATVTATGGYTTYGFGALQAKVAQRARENTLQFDVNANIQGDRFLPRTLNLRVPVGVQYGTTLKEPRFDPLDPDTELKLSLEKFNEITTQGTGRTVDEARAEYRDKVVDRVTTKSLNFLNVRKERGAARGTDPKPGAPATPKAPKPWDIENFAVSYAYTERLQTNITTFRDLTKTYTAGIAYAFQANPKSYSPLSTVKLFASPYFQFLKDFNFTPLPSTFSVRADVDRRYREQFLQRRGSLTELPTPAGVEPVFQKSFYFNRIYDLKWNLTKSLSLDYTATNRGVIDEPDGQIDGKLFPEKNQVIWRNARRLGRTTAFNQLIAATYRLPFDKFPLTSWLQADARYSAGYTWTAISTALKSDTLRLGNTIQNNREQSINAKADLVNLYNRVKFLKAINNPVKPVLDKNGQPIAPDGKGGKGGADGKGAGKIGGSDPRERMLNAAKARSEQEAAAKALLTPKLGPDGKPVIGADGKPVMIAGAVPKPAADTTKKPPELKLLKAVLRGLMSVRSVNGTYTRTDGTLLPGYLPSTALFGFSQGFSAPTPEFILGKQYELQSLYELAAARGWYTGSSQNLNTPISNLFTEAVNLRANVEPFKNFQVQVDARLTRSRAEEAFFRTAVDSITGESLDSLATVQPFITGAFSQSFLSVQTLFEGRGAQGQSAAFERFITNRQQIRGAILDARGLAPGDSSLQNNSQDVLLPAFQRAYAGQTAAGYKTRPFNPLAGLPLPNWRIDYNGLSEVPLLKKYFSSVTLSHAYQSTYAIANFTTSAQYQEAPSGFPDVRSRGKLVPYYVVNTVRISERMAPLLGINIKTKKNITGRLEYKVERDVALNTTNAQVTSIFVQDYVIGLGYITNRFKLPFKTRGVRQTLTNDLTMRLDLTIRDNETVQRTIVQFRDTTATGARTLTESSQNQTTNGTRQIQLKPTIDYVLNQRLNLQLYFTRIVSAPKISSSFRNVVTTAGLQIRYNLGL
ncbi:MAG: cell surface protein SprA [Hymenobacteraceae bacterium]|nr:cell surface protein SprA [Hymenobacteraceae bacterium]